MRSRAAVVLLGLTLSVGACVQYPGEEGQPCIVRDGAEAVCAGRYRCGANGRCAIPDADLDRDAAVNAAVQLDASLELDANVALDAGFVAVRVSLLGPGRAGGAVRDLAGQLSCHPGPDRECSGTVGANDMITLSAGVATSTEVGWVLAHNTAFVRWTGACSTWTTTSCSLRASLAATSSVGAVYARRFTIVDNQHMRCLTSDGVLRCWGECVNSEIGAPCSDAGVGTDVRVETLPFDFGRVVGTGASIMQVAVGSDSACAVTYAGNITCWGKNGQWDVDDTRQPHLVAPDRFHGVVDLADGMAGVCVLFEDGTVLCTDENANGFGGRGDGDAGAPKKLASDGGGDPHPRISFGSSAVARQISADNGSACAVFADGSLRCWGDGTHGRLGTTTTTTGRYSGRAGDSAPAWPLTLRANVGHVDVGYEHACAADDRGDVYCWGLSNTGSVVPQSPMPVAVVTPTLQQAPWSSGCRAVEVSTGWYPFSGVGGATCALCADGLVSCWGDPRARAGAGSNGGFLTASTEGSCTCGVQVTDGGPRLRCWGQHCEYYSIGQMSDDGGVRVIDQPLTP